MLQGFQLRDAICNADATRIEAMAPHRKRTRPDESERPPTLMPRLIANDHGNAVPGCPNGDAYYLYIGVRIAMWPKKMHLGQRKEELAGGSLYPGARPRAKRSASSTEASLRAGSVVITAPSLLFCTVWR